MFKMILYGFLIYLLYKFIFELVVPISRATSQMKDKLQEMQQQQARQQSQQQTPPPQQAAPKADKAASDYIEFEEVKP